MTHAMIATLLCGLILRVGVAFADVSGTEWRALSDDNRAEYVIGVTDAWSQLIRFTQAGAHLRMFFGRREPGEVP